MTSFRVIPERSQLWMEARSDLHPIHGEGLRLRGEAEVEVQDGQVDLSVASAGRIELDVEEMTSGSAFEDHEMRRRLDAKKFPVITAELRRVTACDDPHRFSLQSDITFHGVARRLPIEVTAMVEGDQMLIIDGEFTVDIRGFGVTPPRVLGLQVYPEVKVRLHVVLEPQS